MAERLRTILHAVLQEQANQQQPLLAIQRRWGRLVGKELAGHTKPVSLRRGRLVVHVDQLGDGFTLNYRRAQVLKRLETETPGRVQEIVIRVGAV